MKDYNGLSCDEMREMLLNNGIKHNNMSQADYESLLAHESCIDSPDTSVLDFCTTGLKKFDEYKDLDDFQICVVAGENRRKRAEKWREALLNRDFEENLSQSDYEFLLELESELFEPDIAVLMFCIAGLKQYDKYINLEDIQIYSMALFNPVERWEEKYKNPIRHFNIYRRAIVAIIAIFIILLFANITAAALGFNLIDFFRNALNSSEKSIADSEGREMILTDSTRFYNSMSELLESENFNILYPVKLPNGYNFTTFEVNRFGDELEIIASSTKPYIEFVVKLGVEVHIIDYFYEENNIKYNILDMNDMCQAYWFSDTDYYWITVSDRAVLSEIIKNLKES